MSKTMTTQRGSHLGRVWVIGVHTFTQLVRMKVFYFLAVFGVIAIASNFFELAQHNGPESIGTNVLTQIKSWSLGAMHVFSVVLAVVATALLLPKDVEDRTLYTILAKPVPRIDYLLGKLIGVLGLIGISLLLMDGLMVGVLHFRTSMVLSDQLEYAKSMNWSAADIELMKQETLAYGATWSLQGAVLALFFRAGVIAAFAAMVSTFSTSTLFTTIIAFIVYLMGYFQADAREVYLNSGQAGQTLLVKLGALVVAMVFPDFQLYNVVDAVIQGQVISLESVGMLSLVCGYYMFFYTMCSWYIFSDKEF